MESVENLLVDLILNKQSGISVKLVEQEAELAALECTEPEGAGAWLKEFEAPVIIEILKSSEEYFSDRFGGVNDLDAEGRSRLADHILEHSRECPRCSRKVLMDEEFAQMVDGVIENNRDKINQDLALTTDRE